MTIIAADDLSTHVPTRRALTKRQIQIAALLAGALGPSEIANKLGMTEQTVKNHLRTIYGKLGITQGCKWVILGSAALDARIRKRGPRERCPYESSCDYRLANILGEREMMLVKYISQGLTNQQIGRKMEYNETQIKGLLSRLYKKVGVSNRLELAVRFHRERLCGKEKIPE